MICQANLQVKTHFVVLVFCEDFGFGPVVALADLTKDIGDTLADFPLDTGTLADFRFSFPRTGPVIDDVLQVDFDLVTFRIRLPVSLACWPIIVLPVVWAWPFEVLT